MTYHVIPSHPTAKKELKTKRKTAAAIPVFLFVCAVVPARTAMDMACPAAPKIMSFRRPAFSMMKIAINEASQYSVPFRAASKREVKPERPMPVSNMVAE